MIREVDLVNYYLPPFMQNYKESVETLNAEQPEFHLVWKAADRVLYNRFISTADEYGIARFEKILGIMPDKEASLESRRLSVQTAWISTAPYTIKTLINKMISLYGDDNFTVEMDFSNSYELNVVLKTNMYNQYKDLVNLLENTVPANIVINVRVEMPVFFDLDIYSCAAISYVPIIQIGG